MVKHILLTFDLEEFDLPRKYGTKISEEEMYGISREGAEKLLGMLDRHKINTTFFVTALFAKKYPKLIKQIAKKHEIGMHGYAHSDSYEELSEKEIFARLKKAKGILEKISGKKVTSFRSQRLQKISPAVLKKIGLKSDSSILPTFIPLSFVYTLGRFENLFKSRKIFSENGIIEVPLTVTPLVRIPLLWITFRNMPPYYAYACTRLALMNNNFVNLILHPWEFVDISGMEMPSLIKNNTGNALLKKFELYIAWAKNNNYRFSAISKFLNENGFDKAER